MKYATLDAGVAAYCEFLKEEYEKFMNRSNLATPERKKEMIEEFNNSINVRKGKKYIKILANNSVKAFIVAKEDNMFNVGDLLKAASFAAPAKNAARGNVLEGKFSGTWTGPAYMK